MSFTVQDGSSPLHVASKKGHNEVVDTLLKNGANPNQADTVLYGLGVDTPLSDTCLKVCMYTCYCFAHLRVVSVHCMWLVKRATLRYWTLYWRMGQTPTKLLRYSHSYQCIVSWTGTFIVCTFCACVRVYSSASFFPQKGISPLYAASQRGHTDMVQNLLIGGADPNLTSMVWELV